MPPTRQGCIFLYFLNKTEGAITLSQSCDVPRALISIASNLCWDETEPRRLHWSQRARAPLSSLRSFGSACLEDVFSCYFLDRTETRSITLICVRAITQSVSDTSAITRSVWELWHSEGSNIRGFKFLLRWDRTEENALAWQFASSFVIVALMAICVLMTRLPLWVRR